MQLLPQAIRLQKAIAGQMPDKVPYFEIWWGHPGVEKHFLGHPVSNFEEQVEFSKRIGWGAVHMYGPRFPLPGYTEKVSSDGEVHYSGGTVFTREDVESVIEPDLEEYVQRYLKEICRVHDQGLLSILYLGHCFHTVATNLGLENFSILTCDDPDFLKYLMWKIEDFNQRLIRQLLASEIKPDLFLFDGDCAFKTSSMVSAQMYEELAGPPTRATLELLQQHGILYCFHSDGKMDNIFPHWIRWGIACAHGVEAQANSLKDIKERYGKDITLAGNFDPVFITNATPEEIRREAIQMVNTGKPGGRYIAGLNTIVREYIPVENYLAFLEGIKEAGNY